MRAVVHDRYGPPEVLRLAQVERPVPKDDEVLVRVLATTVNRTDCGLRSAELFISRFFTGLLRPKQKILGMELAGVVEAVGAAVGTFEVGDEVFGIRSGANAEYLCVRESGVLAHKPAGMTFEEAAAVCDGAITALSGLRRADLRKGQGILVYGASGSIGTAAVQVAKHFGAHVTAVCNTKNVELVRSLGADEVIDYLQEDFTKNGETYDVIFDAVRQALVQALQTLAEARRDLPRNRPRVPLARPAPGLVDSVDRRQESGAPDSQVHEEGGPLPQGAHRSREVPSGHRSVLRAGAGGRGDEVCRNG